MHHHKLNALKTLPILLQVQKTKSKPNYFKWKQKQKQKILPNKQTTKYSF